MNRYLLAALYVMAGCAVTVPLKAQANGEVMKSERCRLVVTVTVKMVTVCLDEEGQQSDFFVLPPDYWQYPFVKGDKRDFSFDRMNRIYSGSLCRTSHKIRAPESNRK